MGEPFVGEIRMFGGNFAPAGWAFCDGQLMPISENETLFNLIGTTYGGDGQETFAMPDLQGRLPIHAGTGPFGITYQLGEKDGVESVTLTVNQIAAHTHPMLASTGPGSANSPEGNLTGEQATISLYIQDNAASPLSPNSVGSTGGSQPHSNFQPYLCINFIISLFGVFPSQN
jgi:microcystin-dependent protein